MRTDPRDFVKRRLHGSVSATYRFEPHYNLAPTQAVATVPNTPARALTEMRWSLVPRFGRDPLASRLSTFNARVETLASSNVFAPLLATRRAVVLADGYYEWRKNRDGTKTPLWIFRRDGEPIAFAALWDRSERSGQAALESVTIVTREPVPALAAIHDRMPLVLAPERADLWLRSGRMEAAEALALLLPSEPDAFGVHAVSPRVGNVRNDDATLCAPVPDPIALTLPLE